GDMNFPTYRQQGLLLCQDYPLVDMICQEVLRRGTKAAEDSECFNTNTSFEFYIEVAITFPK
ncbi:hypothetical protein COB11_06510, partial [Candidatus Aerophobetes bacterium]